MKVVRTVHDGYASGTPIKRIKGSISIPAGKRGVIKLAVGFSEGFIKQLYVRQIPSSAGGGTPVNFSVNLYSSKIPFGDGTTPVNELDPPNGDDGLYSVINGNKTATAGNPVSFHIFEGDGYAFFNDDQINQDIQPYLYLVITPQGSLTTTKWIFSITAVVIVP